MQANIIKIILFPAHTKIVAISISDKPGIIGFIGEVLPQQKLKNKKPCVILRPETEWVELVECGTAIITDADEQKILDAYKTLTTKTDMKFPKLYGDGKAAEFICKEILENLG